MDSEWILFLITSILILVTAGILSFFRKSILFYRAPKEIIHGADQLLIGCMFAALVVSILLTNRVISKMSFFKYQFEDNFYLYPICIVTLTLVLIVTSLFTVEGLAIIFNRKFRNFRKTQMD